MMHSSFLYISGSLPKAICLLFVIIMILIITIPFLLNIELKINLLRAKGHCKINLLKMFHYEFKFRIKNGYIYFYHKGKEKKEKISSRNESYVFITQLMKQTYFRTELINLNLISSFGYCLSALTTALGCSVIDIVSKSIFAKLKNNKKTSHIFTMIEPKYDSDVCTIKLNFKIKTAIIDLGCSTIYSMAYCVAKHLNREFN